MPSFLTLNLGKSESSLTIAIHSVKSKPTHNKYLTNKQLSNCVSNSWFILKKYIFFMIFLDFCHLHFKCTKCIPIHVLYLTKMSFTRNVVVVLLRWIQWQWRFHMACGCTSFDPGNPSCMHRRSGSRLEASKGAE